MTNFTGATASDWADGGTPRSHPAHLLPEQRQFLAHLWQAIEQLPPLQRSAYLLNFPAGERELFWVCGIASLRQIGRLLPLKPEQFQLVWLLLEWRTDQREQAQRLTNYDEQFALLWQQLPLNDYVIAALLGTNRQNVLSLQRAAQQRLRRKLSDWL